MRYANYSVVRYVADPARNEALNVGIVLWSNNRFSLEIDDTAAARIIRENPRLERDALLYLGDYLTDLLAHAEPPFTAEGFLKILEKQASFPVVFSEPRSAAVEGDKREELEQAKDRLLARIVRPRRRGGGAPGLRAVAILERELKPLIHQHAISRHHIIGSSGSGIQRSVDFYANSGANLALDVLNLALVRADDIRTRADAEAFKVFDLLNGSDVNRYLVYCLFSNEAALAETNENAKTVLASGGGEVVPDLDDAKDMLASAVGHGTLEV